MNEKRRRDFEIVTEYGTVLFRGILYDEGNVVLSWRADYDVMYGNGYCSEQFSDIGNVMSITPTAHALRWVKPPKPKKNAKNKALPYQKFIGDSND